MKKACLCVIAAGLLTGCSVDSQPYPRYWPPMVMNQADCPDLTGRYQINNDGCEGHQCASLPDQFPQSFWPGWPLARDLREVELQGPREGQLMIHYPAADGGPGKRFTLQRGTDFQCESNQMVLEKLGNFVAGDGAIAHRSAMRRYFSRTVDGSLVMRETGSVGGIFFLFIPLYLSSETWTRWAPSGK